MQQKKTELEVGHHSISRTAVQVVELLKMQNDVAEKGIKGRTYDNFDV